jgi:hypothetical protein
MRSVETEGVIIADKVCKEERLIIVDQCLIIRLYIVPLIAYWENQKRYPKSKTIQIGSSEESQNCFG